MQDFLMNHELEAEQVHIYSFEKMNQNQNSMASIDNCANNQDSDGLGGRGEMAAIFITAKI